MQLPDTETQIKIAKIAIRWTVIGGTSKLVHGLFDNNTEPETLYQKMQVVAGTFAVGGMVGAYVGDYTNDQIDNVIAQAREIRKSYLENKASKQ